MVGGNASVTTMEAATVLQDDTVESVSNNGKKIPRYPESKIAVWGNKIRSSTMWYKNFTLQKFRPFFHGINNLNSLIIFRLLIAISTYLCPAKLPFKARIKISVLDETIQPPIQMVEFHFLVKPLSVLMQCLWGMLECQSKNDDTVSWHEMESLRLLLYLHCHIGRGWRSHQILEQNAKCSNVLMDGTTISSENVLCSICNGSKMAHTHPNIAQSPVVRGSSNHRRIVYRHRCTQSKRWL